MFTHGEASAVSRMDAEGPSQPPWVRVARFVRSFIREGSRVGVYERAGIKDSWTFVYSPRSHGGEKSWGTSPYFDAAIKESEDPAVS